MEVRYARKYGRIAFFVLLSEAKLGRRRFVVRIWTRLLASVTRSIGRLVGGS
jgi:hypothetical protein